MTPPERPIAQASPPRSSLALHIACGVGLALAGALALAGLVVHGNFVRIMFGGAAVAVIFFTWSAWHYFRLPKGHEPEFSEDELRHRDSKSFDES